MSRRSRNVGRNSGPPSSYSLAKLPSDPGGIEPPTLTGDWVNNDEIPKFIPSSPPPASSPNPVIPHGTPSVDTEIPGYIDRDAGMYNPNDLGRYNEPNIYNYQDATREWLSSDISHHDDSHLFSFSDLHSSDVSTGQNPLPDNSGHTYGPADFMFTQHHQGSNPDGFDVGRFVSQYPRFPAGPIAANNSSGLSGVDHGRITIGGDESFGYNSGSDQLGGTAEQNPNVSNEQLIADQRAQLGLGSEKDSSGKYIDSPSSSPTSPAGSRIGVGTITNMNSRIGTANNPIFGVGQNSGQHYFNDGTGWKPIGQGSTDVRWAQNSGTGNLNATAATNNYLLSGGEAGVPNLAQPDQIGYSGEITNEMDAEWQRSDAAKYSQQQALTPQQAYQNELNTAWQWHNAANPSAGQTAPAGWTPSPNASLENFIRSQRSKGVTYGGG